MTDRSAEPDLFNQAPSQDRSRLRALWRSGLLERAGEEQFALIVEHVRDVMDAPVAVISLIDADRQFFAGHCGLPEPWASIGETPLSHSFCRHVVERGAPVAIDDARTDPTVRDNPAIPEIGIHAYLGVPLTLPTGEVVGALAAIDGAPRQWSQHDLRRLKSIARLVMSEMAVRVSEAKWRSLFDEMREGFILGEVVRDAEERIADWRYEEVNRAWGELVGLASEGAVGRTIRDLFPGIEDEWVDDVASAVETNRPVSFTRPVAALGRWYDGTVHPIGNDRFTILFADVTERRRQEQALARIEQRHRALIETVDVGICIIEMIVDEAGRPVDYRFLDANPALERQSGMAGVVGRRMREFAPDHEQHWFDLYGRVAATGEPAHFENGAEGLGGRWFEVDAIRVGEPSERQVAVLFRDVSERRKGEERRTLLNTELAHRLKNTLAVVQSIVNQTLRSAVDLPSARKSVLDRIQTLSKAHDILLTGESESAGIADILRAAATLHGGEGRVRMRGPDIRLGPKAALTLALLVHELATNAGKYGALSGAEGHVAVEWSASPDARTGLPVLVLDWIERGGPPVSPPTRQGFGTRLVRMGLSGSSDGSVDIDYAPEGLTCRIVAPLTEPGS